MSNNWGGQRPGAGRKPGAQFKSRIELMATVFTSADWATLLKHLFERAMSDDKDSTRAAMALLRYQFGDSILAIDKLDLQRAGLITDPAPAESDEDEDASDEANEADSDEELQEQGDRSPSPGGGNSQARTPNDALGDGEFKRLEAMVANAKNALADKRPDHRSFKRRRHRFRS